MRYGFLKNFNRYRRKNLSLHDRFIKPEEKDQAWIDKFFEVKKGKGVKNYFQFAKLFYSTKLDFYSCDILYLISNFTLAKEFQEIDIQKYIGLLKAKYKWRLKDIKVVEGGKQLLFKPRFGKEFRATKLTAVSPEANTISKNLENLGRQKNCHWLSIYMAMSYVDTSVVTGDAWAFASRCRSLHSWVEQKLQDGTEVCVDLTKNVLMRKKVYYSLFHIRPLERITREQILEDMEIIKPLTDVDSNYTKLYLSSREEALAIAEEKERSGEIVRLPPIGEGQVANAREKMKAEREGKEK